MPATTDPDTTPADLTIPAHVLEQWTGRTFTADEAARLLSVLSDSSVSDAVSAVAQALFSTRLEWTDDPDGEPGDLTAESKRIRGDNTAAYYSLFPANGDLDTDKLWTLHHTQTHDHDNDPAAVTFLGNHPSLDDAKTRAQLFEAS